MVTHQHLQVAKDTINEKFVTFLQQTGYKLDRPQRKLVRKYVKSGIAAAANLRIKDIQNQMLKSQSMRQKPLAEPNDLLIANELDGHTAELGSLTQYQEECNVGPIGPGKALETDRISYENYPAEKTARPETKDEKEAMPGQFDAKSSSLLDTYVQVKKSLVPRRCISCRARHIKCVPLGTDCEACHKHGKSCSFRPVDLGHHTILSSSQDLLTTGQGGSVSHDIKQGNGFSHATRFESAPLSQGPSVRTRPALFGTGLPNQGKVRVSGPLPKVNESGAKGNNITCMVNMLDLFCVPA